MYVIIFSKHNRYTPVFKTRSDNIIMIINHYLYSTHMEGIKFCPIHISIFVITIVGGGRRGHDRIW
jgi:hypothetical protein